MADDTIDFGDDEFLSDEKIRGPSARKAELSDLLKRLKAGAAAETKRFVDATDSEYWVCVCFQTREQKEDFLDRMGWTPMGDKYLDGLDVAALHGIKLPPAPQPGARKISRRWKEFVGFS